MTRVLRTYLAVPPSPGGMEKHIHELSQRQRASGLEVIQLYCVGDTGRATDVQVLKGWSILYLRPQWLRDLLFYAAAFAAAGKRGLRADVLHVHGDWSAYLFAKALAWRVGARVRIATMHGHVPDRSWRRWLYRVACAGYDGMYATGVREAQVLSAWTGRTWHWITSGVQEWPVAAVSTVEPCDVLTVASLVPVKNLSLVLDAAAMLPHRRFRIIGDGPLAESLAEEVRERGLANVELAGPRSHTSMPAEYAAARMFLLTSLQEGTPTALLEAIAAGLPVAITPCNDLDPVVKPGQGGVVIPSWKATDVVACVEMVLADGLLWLAMSDFNRARGGDYAWSSIAARVTSLMEPAA